MKEKWKELPLVILKIMIVVFIISFVPVSLYLLLANKATLSEWLGFFGTYFGSTISIGFSYINTRYQLKKKYEKEIVDNLRKLSRSIEVFLQYVYDLQEILYQLLNKKVSFQSKNDFRELSQKISDVTAQIDSFTVEFDSVMNQLEESETKKIGPTFKIWFDGYHSFYFIKSICNNYSTNTMLSDYLIRELLKNIESFTNRSIDLKLTIVKVYKKRLKNTIG